MNRLRKSFRALGFDRGASLRHPRLRRGLSMVVRSILIAATVGACGVAVLATAGTNMGTFVPHWLTFGTGQSVEAPPPARVVSDPVDGVADAPVKSPTGITWGLLGMLSGFPTQLSAVASSGDGLTVAAAGRDGSLGIWRMDGTEWQRVTAPAVEGRIRSLALSGDGALMGAGFADGRVGFYAAGQDSRIRTIQSHRGPVTAVTLAPDGQRLYSGGNDGFLRCINLPTLASPSEHAVGEPIRQLAVCADAGLLTLLGGDGRVRMHSMLTLASLCAPGAGGCEFLLPGPEGRRLMCLMRDGTARIVRTGNLDQIATIDAPGGELDGWRTAGVLSDGTVLLAGTDGVARVHLPTGEVLNRAAAVLQIEWLDVEATLPAPIHVLARGDWPGVMAIWPGGMVARLVER